MKKSVLFALASVLLSACVGVSTCDNLDAGYRKAAAIPPIQPAEGLKLPESPSALKVPELTPAAKTAATQPLPRKGKGTACLDYPPEIAPTEAASSAAKS